eukprot:COSAG01_NODE_6684_length_3545_cov_1.480267_3_plen_23_part_01
MHTNRQVRQQHLHARLHRQRGIH